MRSKVMCISIILVGFIGIFLFAGLYYIEHKEAATYEKSRQEPIEKTMEPEESKKDLDEAETIEIIGNLSTEMEDDSTTLLFAGDVYLSSHVTNRYNSEGIEGVLDSCLLQRIQEADIFMLNQEFPFGTAGIPAEDKQYTFRVNPGYISVFQDMGVDVVSLANNHVLDYGQEVLKETFHTLKESHILYAGAGENLEDARALRTIKSGGKVYGFLSASRVIPEASWNAGQTTPGVFTTYDSSQIVEKIADAQKQCDFLTVYVHWGIERNTTPESYQKELAHAYIDAGADLVIGAHPHVLQGIESYQGKLIFYSLGNFIFNQNIEKTMLVQLKLQGEQLQYSVVPAYAKGAKTEVYTEEENFYSYLQDISDGITIDHGRIIQSKNQ